MIELTHRNTRRYGGYLVHMGIVIMFIGFTGAAFNKDTTQEVKIGDRFQLGRYDLHVKEITDGDNSNYSVAAVRTIDVYDGGEYLRPRARAPRLHRPAGSPPPKSPFAAASTKISTSISPACPRRRQQGHHPGLCVPAGQLDLDRLLGAVMFGTLVCLIPAKSEAVLRRALQ